MRNIAQTLRRPAIVSFILANLVFALLLGLRMAGVFQPVELLAYDFGLRLKPAAAIDDRIVLVGFTDEDIKTLGYPASDDLLARILEHLSLARARAIGVDIYRDIPVPPGTDQLNGILKKNPNIIWITNIGKKEGQILPPKSLLNTDQVGFNDMIDDPGGKIRRGLLFMDDGKNSYTSFSLQLALRYLQPLGIGLRPDSQNKDFVRLSSITIPPFAKNDGGYVNADDRGYQYLLDFSGMPKRFKHYSFSELLSGKVPPSFMKDKIVLVGMMANSVNDFFYTPFSEGENIDQRIYGIELHGFATSELLRFAVDGAKPIRIIDENVENLWIWLWVTLGAATGFFVRALSKFIFFAAVELFVLTSAYYFASVSLWWIPIVPPFLGFMVAAGIAASFMADQMHMKSQFIRRTFGRYISNEVVENLLESPDGLDLGGKSMVVTVMFTDLRGFSAMSEVLPPESVVAMLNDYLKEMTEVVFKYSGTINEFMGDGILVLFGAPTMRQDDAARAVACAIEMQLAMEKVNIRNKEKNLPALEMGIGINTGRVVAGNVGSEMRVKYSVVGSNVNLAARVESYTVGGQVLITESTLNAIPCELKRGGEFIASFKGFKEPVTIYEVTGIGGLYNLSLPEKGETFLPLKEKLPIIFELFDGKEASGESHEGIITSLSEKSALMSTQLPLRLFSNLKFTFSGIETPAYAKVIKLREGGEHEIHFTSISDDIASFFAKRVQG